MLTIKRLALLALFASLALAACASAVGDGARTESDVAVGNTGGGDAYSAESVAPAEAPLPDPAKDAAAGLPAQVERLVIKNATLSLVVADPSAAVERISALATSLDGYVVSSYTYQASVDAAGKAVMQASLTVRVPSAQLDAALAQIRGMAVEVRTENISGQDVTGDYTDLQSRLRNLEAAEAQLQNIMDGATKTEDVLAVFNQLVYIREQIEQVKGQIEYYEQSAALSAISLDLIPDVLSQPLEVGGWRPAGVAKEALEALVRAFQGLATFAIWLGILVLPIVVVIVLPLYLVGRFALRRLRRSRPKTTAA
jgi:hypothetical protein